MKTMSAAKKDKLRLFVAIPVSHRLASSLSGIIKNIKSREIRWTREENIHITIHFLGYVDKSSVPGIHARLRDAIKDTESFTLSFDKVIFAPPGSEPRMIWALFRDGSNSYEKLAGDVASALGDFSGGAVRKSTPHVTLARFKVPTIAKTIELTNPRLNKDELEVNSIELMQSHLSPHGAIYDVVHKYDFV